jgi:hypothetical protein
MRLMYACEYPCVRVNVLLQGKCGYHWFKLCHMIPLYSWYLPSSSAEMDFNIYNSRLGLIGYHTTCYPSTTWYLASYTPNQVRKPEPSTSSSLTGSFQSFPHSQMHGGSNLRPQVQSSNTLPSCHSCLHGLHYIYCYELLKKMRIILYQSYNKKLTFSINGR